jgi:hypothetical protein
VIVTQQKEIIMAYHPKITAQFGADLFRVLGPAAERVPWSSLSLSEQMARLKKVPAYIDTRKLGKYPTLVDIVILCFNELVLMGADNPLLGIDLPVYDSLNQAAEKLNTKALNYDSTNLQGLEFLVKNAAKQRDVFLQHIFTDIIFRFNPGLVLPGVGRKSSKGFIFVNDAQHRILACIMLGIETVPINYIESDDEFWDVAQYAAINIHSLIASEFDRYRIRVQREKEARAAGHPSEPEDAISYELDGLFDHLGITVTEKTNRGHGNGLVLTGIGNMIKYRIQYGQDFFTRSTTINAQLFPSSKFQTANSWGLMEFFKYQNLSEDKLVVDYAISNAIRKRWSRPSSGNQLHKNIKDAYKAQTDSDATNSRIPEELIIAHGIYQVCKKYSPEINWTEPFWDKKFKKFELALV